MASGLILIRNDITFKGSCDERAIVFDFNLNEGE
jgi:hypothetical protein